MTVEAEPDVLSESWLDESIPCKSCSNPAKLRSMGHLPVDCRGGLHYRCLKCWTEWVAFVMNQIANFGEVKCTHCGEFYPTLESFSDYKEF